MTDFMTVTGIMAIVFGMINALGIMDRKKIFNWLCVAMGIPGIYLLIKFNGLPETGTDLILKLYLMGLTVFVFHIMIMSINLKKEEEKG